MTQIIAATFKDGVFLPDQRPPLSDSTRVRLTVETLPDDEAADRKEAWAALERLWAESNIRSGGDYMTREQRHERS